MRKTTTLKVLLIVLSVGGTCDAATPSSDADLNGDQVVDWRDFQILASYWLHDFSPPVHVKWMGHASVKIWIEELIVYVDPIESLQDAVPDATLVLITHSHGDHLSTAAINRVSGPNTVLLGPPDVIAGQGRGQTLAPGGSVEIEGVKVTGVAAYNTASAFHPRANNWLGYIIEMGGVRIYCAGDTDAIPEMRTLVDIDVAFLPAGGTFTMNAQQAAEATGFFGPSLAIPYHWNSNLGTIVAARQFASLAVSDAKVMEIGETLLSSDWLGHSDLVGHWPLDQSRGVLAYDYAGGMTGMIEGDPLWQPQGGQIGGALELDGAGNYLQTGKVLVPSDGPFTVSVWVRGGAPGQVILSSARGPNWLLLDPETGALRTDLGSAGRGGSPLVSDTTVSDGAWRQVALVWDGSTRFLYVDGVEAGRRSASQMDRVTGAQRFGAGPRLDSAQFWQGSMDDLRMYDRALSAEELAALGVD